MNIKNRSLRSFFGIAVSAILLMTASAVFAQTDSAPKKRLQSPAKVSGVVGGESHDGYVIKASRGQRMQVQITWRRESGNKAEFTVSRSANFYNASQVAFGKESAGGKTWIGRIPRTGNYYIYVVANPRARYTLKVTML